MPPSGRGRGQLHRDGIARRTVHRRARDERVGGGVVKFSRSERYKAALVGIAAPLRVVRIRDQSCGDQNFACVVPGSDRYRDMLAARRVERRSRREAIRDRIVDLGGGERMAIVLLPPND